MFIQTEATPNPATLKFVPGKPVLEGGTRDYRDPAEASTESPLAARLFEVDGVEGVFFGTDFISVTKGDAEWQHLKPMILGVIMDHYLSDAPVLSGTKAASDDNEKTFNEREQAIVDSIKELIETRVRPAVAQDGGDIEFHDYSDGIVYLKMRGACAGCPSSTATLQNGIENLFKHFLPEIQEVRPVE